MKRRLFLLGCLGTPALALDPSEMLDDPDLEARARALDHAIRCVKCQSEAVASSNASWAQDARRQIRELIASGATDAEVEQWFVDRYGEFVLMDPSKSGSNIALWLAGPVMLGISILGAAMYLKGRSAPSGAAKDTGLSADEETRLREILKE